MIIPSIITNCKLRQLLVFYQGFYCKTSSSKPSSTFQVKCQCSVALFYYDITLVVYFTSIILKYYNEIQRWHLI